MNHNSVDNALYNILANLIRIVVVTIVTFTITRILVAELGEELYGVVPLFNSINSYAGLSVIVISASVGRFVSLSFFKEDMQNANKYYSSSFFSLFFISGLVFVLALALSFFLDDIFQFPNEKLKEVQVYFILTIGSMLMLSMTAIFNVSVFIKHTFYMSDIITVISKIIQIIFLFLGHITLIWFGFSLLTSAITLVVLTYLVSVKILPILKIKLKNISIPHAKDMGKMGVNSLFNSLGILLYTSSDIIIINILLGSAKSGNYGIALQCGMIITLLGGSITKLLAPVLVELIAKQQREKIITSIVRFTKFITVFSAIPFVLFLGFSKPILVMWLGEGYESLYLITIFISFNQLLHQTTSLTFTYFNMENKLRIPAITTFVAGILNIALSILIVKYTNLGMYGVVLATLITIFLKTIIFNVVYASRLLKTSPFAIWKSALTGLYWPIILGLLCFFVFKLIIIDSIFILSLAIIVSLIIYIIGVLYLPLNLGDRLLLRKISKIDKIFSFIGNRNKI